MHPLWCRVELVGGYMSKFSYRVSEARRMEARRAYLNVVLNDIEHRLSEVSDDLVDPADIAEVVVEWEKRSIIDRLDEMKFDFDLEAWDEDGNPRTWQEIVEMLR